jgi:carbamate kinase
MGYTMVEDAGRGYRRVVPSPMPIDVKEKHMIRSLLEAGHIVITVGGGGIPVIEKDGRLEGVAAVIDKDNASETLAELIDADRLVILTAVDNVFIDFGMDTQEALHEVTVERLNQLVRDGHFAPGSMLPKIQASMRFASKGKTAIIASLDNASKAFQLQAGTIITNE